MKRISFCIVFLYICVANLTAQHLYDARQSILLQAVVEENPSRITLHWVLDTANGGYTIWRKSKYDLTWKDSLTSLSPSSISWTDSTVVSGIAYEYQVIKSLPAYPYGNGTPNFGSGYIYSGIRRAPVHHSGTCLVVIDHRFQQSLSFEISRLMLDMEAEGWYVDTIYIDRNASVKNVKENIRSWAVQQRDTNQAVFLLGRVPVPYAGEIVPDGHHSDHKGAWPCDGYYADPHGLWTDQTVNTNIPPGTRNDNLPGDGKFDNNVIPAPVEIQIGRVDFANMTKFSESEEQMLRRYLEKDHQWRSGLIQAKERALVDNNFRDIEGLGSVGWKNFVPMFGYSQVKDVEFRQTLSNQSYLWAYGCGGGGPESASDISSTTNFTNDSLQTIFVMMFGSYFGDWDYPNNFLRAAIASRTCLASTWGNRPSWMFHHMALGEPIGYAAQITMNNRGLYYPPFYGGYAHTALMGDPTIKMYNHLPVENLIATQQGPNVHLTWIKPMHSIGYFVYKKTSKDSAFVLQNETPISIEAFVDSCVGQGVVQYRVRSVELRTTSSGTFYNLSPGMSVTIQTDPSLFYPKAAFVPSIYFDQLTLQNNSVHATSYMWNFGDGKLISESQPSHVYDREGLYDLCLHASDGCYADTTCREINIISSLPLVNANIKDVNCYKTATGSIQLQITGGTPKQTIKWLNLPDTGSLIQNLTAGTYTCVFTSATGKTATFGPYQVNEAPAWLFNAQINPADPGRSNGSIRLDPTGGCPPYQFSWNTGQTTSSIQDLSVGTYCATISDCMACTQQFCAEIKPTTGQSKLVDLKSIILYPNPAHEKIGVDLKSEKIQFFRVLLCDVHGKTLADDSIHDGEVHHRFELSTIPAGFYWIKIVSTQGIMVLPFTKLDN